jgi:hypothetical protein
MQMHFESLLAGTRFSLELVLGDERASRAAARDPSKTARKPVGSSEFRDALDGFYRGIWAAEAQRFHAGSGLPALPPAGDAILVRVGRFSHFESASIEGLRLGYRPQSRAARVAPEGSTRMVTRSAGQGLPFGWVALFPDERTADAWAARPIAVARPQGGGGARPAPPAATAQGGRVAAFRKGERVESPQGEVATVLADVPYGTRRMDVEFEDGSTETVPVDGWKRA